MIPSSRCHPWQHDRSGPGHRSMRRRRRTYTTRWIRSLQNFGISRATLASWFGRSAAVLMRSRRFVDETTVKVLTRRFRKTEKAFMRIPSRQSVSLGNALGSIISPRFLELASAACATIRSHQRDPSLCILLPITFCLISPKGVHPFGVRASMRMVSPKCMKSVWGLPARIISMARTSEIQLEPTSS